MMHLYSDDHDNKAATTGPEFQKEGTLLNQDGPEPKHCREPDTEFQSPFPVPPTPIPYDDRFEEEPVKFSTHSKSRTTQLHAPNPASHSTNPALPNDDRFAPKHDSSPVMSLPARANADLVLFIKSEDLHVRSRRPYIDHYRYILHLITERRLTDHRFKDEARHVCIGHKYLHRYISKGKTSTFLKNLIRWEIIESDGQWWNGPNPKAMGYVLTEHYWNDEVVEVPYTDRMLRDKAAKRQSQLDEFDTALDKVGYAECRLWLQALAIDRASAESHIESHWKHRRSEYNFRMEAVKRIALKKFWFWKGKKSQRAFHNLTNLPRDLRCFLSINGQQLRQVDIACSQMALLHAILKPKDVIPEHELRDMEELLASNTFYEAISPPNVTRARAKERFYKEVLFAKKARTTKLTKIFNERFPTYAQEIARMRENESEGGLTRAALLQAAEADVVFPAVQRFSNATNGVVPILTLHDSLVTVPDHVDQAKATLEFEFEERYQFKPVITIK